jgi:hypothetical protein
MWRGLPWRAASGPIYGSGVGIDRYLPAADATISGEPAPQPPMRPVRLATTDRIAYDLVPKRRHHISLPSYLTTLSAAAARIQRRSLRRPCEALAALTTVGSI